MRGMTTLALVFCVGSVLGPGSRAEAQSTILWATSDLGDFQNWIVQIDTADPETIIPIGPTGILSVGPGGFKIVGLEFVPTGELYAYAQRSSTSATSGTEHLGLHLVDPATGNATFLGASGLPAETRGAGLSYDPAGDRLCLIAQRDGVLELYEFDLPNPVPTLVWSAEDTRVSLNSCAFDGCGTLCLGHAENRLVQVCGAGLGYLQTMTDVKFWSQAAMAIDWSGDGTWYLGLRDFQMGQIFLTEIDPLTGQATIMGEVLVPDPFFRIAGMTIQPQPGSMLCLPFADCDGSGVADTCEIASGSLSDCNQNTIPDGCDIAAGVEDCDGNGVPDTCDFFDVVPVTPSYRPALETGDIDGDGLEDVMAFGLFLASSFRANGAGDLEALAAVEGFRFKSGKKLGDMNGDGLADIVYFDNEAGFAELGVQRGVGDGTFGPEMTVVTASNLLELYLHDFDNDGHLDVMAPRTLGGFPFPVLLGDGLGGFESTVMVSDSSPDPGRAFGDFDEDGNLDVIQAKVNAPLSGVVELRLGDGAGDFSLPVTFPAPFTQRGRSLATDVNGDGHVDFMFAGLDQVVVYLGDGAGQLVQSDVFPSTTSARLRASDLNGDQAVDIIAIGGQEWIHWGNGDGTFGPSEVILEPIVNRGFTVLELDQPPAEILISERAGFRVLSFLDRDCNHNGVLDSCDLDSGVSVDENGDGRPDECQPSHSLVTVENQTFQKSYSLLTSSTWQRAEAYANSLGGHLVTVSSVEENAWVEQTFGNFDGEERNLWIGLHDANVEGTYEWSSGNGSGFDAWATGQPDAIDPDRDFVALRPSLGGQWTTELNGGEPGVPFYGVMEVLLGQFLRGDGNGDGLVDIADAIFALGYIFGSGATPTCFESVDANDDGAVDVADAITVLGVLFSGTGPLPTPSAACGIDPTADGLDCVDPGSCN